mmetsp:Transcript_35774/g.143028  ORF Transcript_35774/g.143028 Transcript_35774/m.143028 type:complete len:189 (-) Transcript_35774:45-611(-)
MWQSGAPTTLLSGPSQQDRLAVNINQHAGDTQINQLPLETGHLQHGINHQPTSNQPDRRTAVLDAAHYQRAFPAIGTGSTRPTYAQLADQKVPENGIGGQFRPVRRLGPQTQQVALKQLHATVGGASWGPETTPVLVSRGTPLCIPKLGQHFADLTCKQCSNTVRSGVLSGSLVAGNTNPEAEEIDCA